LNFECFLEISVVLTLSKKLPFENLHLSNRDTRFQVSPVGPTSIRIREQFENNSFDYKVNFIWLHLMIALKLLANKLPPETSFSTHPSIGRRRCFWPLSSIEIKFVTSWSREAVQRNLYSVPTMASGPRSQSLGTTNFIIKKNKLSTQDVDTCPDQRL